MGCKCFCPRGRRYVVASALTELPDVLSNPELRWYESPTTTRNFHAYGQQGFETDWATI
jgi:hypothetical protein